MAVNFPSSPSIGDTFSANGKEWQWDGTVWVFLNVTDSLHAATHEDGGSDEVTLAQSQITNLTSDLAAKAPLSSPTLTGTPIAPTASVGTDTTQIATTAFVNAEISNDAILKTIVDAKGDLIVGTASDTPARLAIGTDGFLLTADSTQTAGISWAAAPDSGLNIMLLMGA